MTNKFPIETKTIKEQIKRLYSLMKDRQPQNCLFRQLADCISPLNEYYNMSICGIPANYRGKVITLDTRYNKHKRKWLAVSEHNIIVEAKKRKTAVNKLKAKINDEAVYMVMREGVVSVKGIYTPPVPNVTLSCVVGEEMK